jgi:hypothetical protein
MSLFPCFWLVALHAQRVALMQVVASGRDVSFAIRRANDASRSRLPDWNEVMWSAEWVLRMSIEIRTSPQTAGRKHWNNATAALPFAGEMPLGDVTIHSASGNAPARREWLT